MYLVINADDSIILKTNSSDEVNRVLASHDQTQVFLDSESVAKLIKLLEEEKTLRKKENDQFKSLVKKLCQDL